MTTLSYRLRVHYNSTADDIAEEAADRIDALEDSERVILASVPEEHRASTAAGTAQNYIAHLEGRIDALEECLRELIDKGDTFGGELRAIKREDEREEFEAALDAFSDSEEVASCVGRIDGYWPKEAETQIIGLWRLANELYAALNPASSQSPKPTPGSKT